MYVKPMIILDSMRMSVQCLLLILCLYTGLMLVLFTSNNVKKQLRLLEARMTISGDSADDRSNDDELLRRYKRYPARQNMSNCPKLYGNVTVLIVYIKRSMETHYRVAQKTLRCYLKSVNYQFIAVDLDEDERVKKACNHKQLLFKKHCAAAQYLIETNWMLVLDADTGVVNPNHCIEEYIDPRVDIIFYERFFNWEIASGNYLIKNTPFARKFLLDWADWQNKQPSKWSGADNGVLQKKFRMHILQTVLPDAVQEAKICDRIWRKGSNYETYMAFVTCVRVYLGAIRLWPGKLRILRRFHGWVRDGFTTGDRWSDRDFMIHGWKRQKIGADGWQSPFEEVPDPIKCGKSTAGWHWSNTSHVSDEEIHKQLSAFEERSAFTYPKEARLLPYLVGPDVGECYPNCDNFTSGLSAPQKRR